MVVGAAGRVRGEEERRGLGLDGDAAGALDGEAIEELFPGTREDGAGELEEAVREGGLACGRTGPLGGYGWRWVGGWGVR